MGRFTLTVIGELAMQNASEIGSILVGFCFGFESLLIILALVAYLNNPPLSYGVKRVSLVFRVVPLDLIKDILPLCTNSEIFTQVIKRVAIYMIYNLCACQFPVQNSAGYYPVKVRILALCPCFSQENITKWSSAGSGKVLEYIRIAIINKSNDNSFLVNNNLFHSAIVTRYNSMGKTNSRTGWQERG